MNIYDVLKERNEMEISLIAFGVAMKRIEYMDKGMDKFTSMVKAMAFVEEYLDCIGGLETAMKEKEHDGLN